MKFDIMEIAEKARILYLTIRLLVRSIEDEAEWICTLDYNVAQVLSDEIFDILRDCGCHYDYSWVEKDGDLEEITSVKFYSTSRQWIADFVRRECEDISYHSIYATDYINGMQNRFDEGLDAICQDLCNVYETFTLVRPSVYKYEDLKEILTMFELLQANYTSLVKTFELV